MMASRFLNGGDVIKRRKSSLAYALAFSAATLAAQGSATELAGQKSDQPAFEVSLAGEGVVDKLKDCLHENGVIPESSWPMVKSGKNISAVAGIPYPIAQKCAAQLGLR
jgi:hypothetical protein